VHLALSPSPETEGAASGAGRWRLANSSANPFHKRFVVEAAARDLRAPAERLHLLDTSHDDWDSLLPLRQACMTPAGSAWCVWGHVHALDTTPATAEAHPAMLESLFGFLRERRARVLRWATLPADTAFHSVLVDWLDDNRLEYRVTKRVSRPVLHAATAEDAQATVDWIGGKRAREFRRLRRRLEEMGELRLRKIDEPHDASEWMADFLAIERSGWKGASGSAIDCRPGERAWFVAVATQAAAEGALQVYALELAGRPIAMAVNFRAGRRVWCFKTAYQDELARWAPGAVLEYESTLAALADPRIDWMDACTGSDDGLMGALWPGRRPVVDLLIATQRSTNHLVSAAALGWRTYLGAKRRGAALARGFSTMGHKKA
jgi:hypothetical protein